MAKKQDSSHDNKPGDQGNKRSGEGWTVPKDSPRPHTSGDSGRSGSFERKPPVDRPKPFDGDSAKKSHDDQKDDRGG